MKAFTCCLVLFTLFACSGKNKEEKTTLKEAYDIQQQVIDLITGINDALNLQDPDGRDSLKAVLHEIEESIFAIPGYELQLSGHEGHDHGHDRPALTADDIKEVQQALLTQLQAIKTSLTPND